MSHPHRGIELIRRLTEDEQHLLAEAAVQGLAPLPTGIGDIHWVNLYLNGAFTQEFPLRRQLHDWAVRTTAQVYADWPRYHLLAYGFIRSPPGNSDGQPFHCDYTMTSSNLFVPLTRVSVLNATQFVRQPLTRARLNQRAEFGSSTDLLEAEGVDAIEVVQLICKPFSLLRLLPGTPHRGIANGEAHDRLMFFLTVDDELRPIDETAFVRYSTSRYESIPSERKPSVNP